MVLAVFKTVVGSFHEPRWVRFLPSPPVLLRKMKDCGVRRRFRTESGTRKVKFAQVIKHRKIEARIYGKSADYPLYRLGYYVAGKRRVRHFATYGEAKAEAEWIVRELANGLQSTALAGSRSRKRTAILALFPA